MKWYLLALKRYADFSGRSRRKEFWYFMLFHFLILSAIIIIFAGPEAILNDDFDSSTDLGPVGNLVFGLYVLGTFIPMVAVRIRRYHDINKSGAYFLVGIIPCLGYIWDIIMLTTEGDRNTNKYGPNPKAEEYLNGY
jgi:uncharacterized membrane protein YhaH (DUF805 family)